METLAILGYAAAGCVLLLLARGLWILKKSGDARLEQAKAQVKAREGRNPADARTYEQETEAKAIDYISRIPLIGRTVWMFKEGER